MVNNIYNLKEVVTEAVSSNVSILQNLPPELIPKIGSLITILKAIGIVFLIYIIYLIISSFFTWRRNRRIDKMYHKINEIDEKLNTLLEKHKITEKKVEAEEKKKEKSHKKEEKEKKR